MGNLVNGFAAVPVNEQDATKVATYNLALQMLDDMIGGKQDITTTGGTTTLVGTPANPQAQHMFLNVTGALASPAIIEIPVAAGTGRNRIYVVKNGTTGAQTLTVRKVGGTGAAVLQGSVALLYYDGSDIASLAVPPGAIATLQGTFRSNSNISDNILTTDFIYLNAANTATCTLPTAVGVTGKVYLIKFTQAGTLATTSSQTIDGSTTRTMSVNDGLVLISDGANWKIIAKI